ncbi:MAG: metal-dependent hydrolase [Gammaproteobacteria bacterium]
MSNAATHRIASGAGVLAIWGYREYKESGEISLETFTAGGVATLTARLPDIIEPACHPNHRQFFHSLAFAGTISYGMYRLYEWEPESDLDKTLRLAGLAAGASYLIHLLLDARTPKGLPVC